jgi:hypothetical protein
VAMIVLADDHGNVRAETRWLEGQVWWSRRFAEVRGEIPRVAVAQAAIEELSAALLIEVYEVRSQLYAHIRSWEKHQRIDNAGKPRVPLPSEGVGISPNLAEVRGEIPQNSAGPPTPKGTTTPTTTPKGTTTPPPSKSHQRAIEAFDSYYQRAHGGARPTWAGKNSKLMSGLLKVHSAEEIERRIRVLEDSPPRWPPAPWDMQTFAGHFDKVSTSSGSTGPETAVEVAIRMAKGAPS